MIEIDEVQLTDMRDEDSQRKQLSRFWGGRFAVWVMMGCREQVGEGCTTIRPIQRIPIFPN